MMRRLLLTLGLVLLPESLFAAPCNSIDSARRFGDTDCDGIKDAGEIYLDDDDAATVQVLTNKTLDVGATGNVVTVTSIIPLRPATCQNTTATLNWDTETANAPAATCVAGTNTFKAYADFDQTTDECLQTAILLPADWTGAVDANYIWLTTATTGSVAWCTQIICVADAETDDPAFPAQAAGNCVTDVAKGTTNQLNTVSDTGLTITGCAASEEMHIRTCRDPNETGAQTDTVAADARLADMQLVIRRAM